MSARAVRGALVRWVGYPDLGVGEVERVISETRVQVIFSGGHVVCVAAGELIVSMSKNDAQALAVVAWGPWAFVGEHERRDRVLRSVGVVRRPGDISSREVFGSGETWEEAFAVARSAGHMKEGFA